MENKYFAELARRLRAAGITAGHPEKNRLTVLLNNQPVLSVSAGSDVFLLPAGSNQPEAGELYHKVAQTADEVYAYWGLDAKTVDHVTAFDRKIQEVDQAVHQWTPTQEHRDAVIQGLYLYAIDMISSLGSDGARESVTECERLMREIAGFWGYESPALDDLYAQIRASLKDQEAWENTVEIGGIQ